jgi:hypothetical protein
MRCLFILLLAIIIPVKGYSQHILVLEKEGNFKRVRYFEGSALIFRSGQENTLFSGVITSISDSSFMLGMYRFKPSDINQIIFPNRKNLARYFGISALSSAATMMVIGGLDRGINQKASPIYDKPTLALAGGFTLAGLLAFLVPEKKYHLPRQRRLRIINVTP